MWLQGLSAVSYSSHALRVPRTVHDIAMHIAQPGACHLIAANANKLSSYWDWAKTAETGLEKSPIFDGSATSLSGNGEYIPSNGTHIDVNGVDLPDGTGGGCVKTGPFKDYQVNLGPIALTVRSASDNGSSIGSTDKKFEWNPRCFKRDLTDDSVKRFANETSVRTLISESKDMNEFQTTMQGGVGDLGVHGGGHYALGKSAASSTPFSGFFLSFFLLQ